MFILTCCSACQDNRSGDGDQDDIDLSDSSTSTVVVPPKTDDEHLVISSDSYLPVILKDAEGNMSHATRSVLRKNSLVKTYYQRIGCNNDTCKQEWVTFTAIQYPKDTILQRWAAGVVGQFYYDASRVLDIKVNGQKSETNSDGEMVLLNTGCSPYSGELNDGGKAMFDYYQARLWVIGKHRTEEHGPSGRYGCTIYCCWLSQEVASYFVAYSTEVQKPSEHYVVSFDRRTGKEMSFADIIKDDNVAELNDLVVDAARQRHYELLRSKNSELTIDKNEGDYSAMLDLNHVGFVENGLAVSTGALPFDQLAQATHILIIPYEKVNHLLVERFRR
ncbi:MAG: hypothetical protein J6Y05_05535 [Bacteroidales bacterium]|nr:hypothetical protein [Bacteroidales bacterium]